MPNTSVIAAATLNSNALEYGFGSAMPVYSVRICESRSVSFPLSCDFG
jgi:hypothetical protein